MRRGRVAGRRRISKYCPVYTSLWQGHACMPRLLSAETMCMTPGSAAQVPRARPCAGRIDSAAQSAAAEPQDRPAAQAQGLPWTVLMDASLAAAAAEAGATPADVLAACRRVPFDAAMREVRSRRFIFISTPLGAQGLSAWGPASASCALGCVKRCWRRFLTWAVALSAMLRSRRATGPGPERRGACLDAGKRACRRGQQDRVHSMKVNSRARARCRPCGGWPPRRAPSCSS